MERLEKDVELDLRTGDQVVSRQTYMRSANMAKAKAGATGKRQIEKRAANVRSMRAEEATLRRAFSLMDKDGDGKVTTMEFVLALKRDPKLAHVMNLDEEGRARGGFEKIVHDKNTLIKRFYSIDRDHSKTLDQGEFIDFCTQRHHEFHDLLTMSVMKRDGRKLKNLNDVERIACVKLFLRFDSNHNGRVGKMRRRGEGKETQPSNFSTSHPLNQPTNQPTNRPTQLDRNEFHEKRRKE